MSGALLGAAVVYAKPPEGKGKLAQDSVERHAVAQGSTQGDLVQVSIGFETARRLALQHGLTGHAALPPGIRRNLARGKPLPPGIARRTLPAPYLGQLPVHPGYEWGMVGSDLVLQQVATGVIAGVLSGVFN
jgi:hypothetical protein